MFQTYRCIVRTAFALHAAFALGACSVEPSEVFQLTAEDVTPDEGCTSLGDVITIRTHAVRPSHSDLLSMNHVTALQLLQRGNPLAAVVPARRDDARAWVAVYPLSVGSADAEMHLRRFKLDAPPRSTAMYCVRVIEVPQALLSDNRWLADEDVEHRHDVTVFDEDALWAELDRIGVGRDALEQHWKVDYPL